jgi:hypothetical protein
VRALIEAMALEVYDLERRVEDPTGRYLTD